MQSGWPSRAQWQLKDGCQGDSQREELVTCQEQSQSWFPEELTLSQALLVIS